MAQFTQSQVTESPDGTRTTFTTSFTFNPAEEGAVLSLLSKAKLPGLPSQAESFNKRNANSYESVLEME